jgi:hypothetical protein
VEARLVETSGKADGMVYSSGVVNACATMLASAAPAQPGGPIMVMDSLAAGRLMHPSTRAAAVAGYFRRLGKRVQDWGTLLVPVFYPPPRPTGIGHWAMVRVRMHDRTMVMADSMSDVMPARAERALRRLEAALNALLVRDGLPSRVWSRTLVTSATQQQNDVDCGPLATCSLFPLLWGAAWTPRSRIPLLRRTLGYHLWQVGAEAVGLWDSVLRRHTRGSAAL